ncbi:MAG: anthranilate synthase component II [Phycisphaerales bacterium]|jgi:anthranilate synthase component 2
MVLLLDNYDSFTFNLVQCLAELGASVEVRRNDAITVEEAIAMAPQRLVISPGPGRPAEAGISIELMRGLAGRCPILGVCLGHQAIGELFGGRVVRAPAPRHGKTSPIEHDGRGLFAGLPFSFEVGRYHSLVVEESTWPAELEIVARSTDDGLVMGLRHRSLSIHGVQFHPESILTKEGRAILRNFLALPATGSNP